MRLSTIFNPPNVVAPEETLELLALNRTTEVYGLTLTSDEIRQLLTARNRTLRHYGRLELGIGATPGLIEAFSESPYMHQEVYLSSLIELHEMFYDLKNETEDKLGDAPLIELMKEMFDNECGGALELLRGKLEELAVRFRIEASRAGWDGGHGE